MSDRLVRVPRLAVFSFLVASAAPLSGQTLVVGQLGIPGDPIAVSAPSTVLQPGFPANRDGRVTEATFLWSAAPCPAAVKIKFFRPSSATPGGQYLFLDQRGPFDVAELASSAARPRPATQTVRLDPPVELQVGDIVAISNLTSCGSPLSAVLPPRGIPAPAPYYAVPGDVTGTVSASGAPQFGPFVSLASDDGMLSLLGNRFRASLVATNPRTGQITNGVPVAIENAAGYFTLPGLTGDPLFPEIMLKMVDATASPSLGGTFWVFHSPLTDTTYQLTVVDTTTGRTRTYTNGVGAPGQLCGGVDTSAFVP